MPDKYVKCRKCGRRMVDTGVQAEVEYQGKTVKIPNDVCTDCVVKAALEIGAERDKQKPCPPA